MQSPDPSDEFLRAYDKMADPLFRHCYFRVYDREKARDLVQDTFTRAWNYVTEGKSIANMRAFLYKIANNLIIDHARKRKESSLEELQDQGFQRADDNHEQMVRGIEAKAAIRMLQALEPDARDIVVMRYIDDMSPKEIAAILDVNENAVSVRLHRAIKRLRSAMPAEHSFI